MSTSCGHDRKNKPEQPLSRDKLIKELEYREMRPKPLRLTRNPRDRLGEIKRFAKRLWADSRLPAIVLLIIFLAYSLPLAMTGSFVDEDEKIAAGVYAFEGWMPYRDVLLNHGPLLYLLGCLGYKVGGGTGALFALRALPILLGSISILTIRKGSLFRTSSYTLLARVVWTALLLLLWSRGTLKMGIYHGVGGLTACILIGQCLAPLQIGNRLKEAQMATAIAISLLLITESLTFAPCAALSILAVYVGTRATLKDRSSSLLRLDNSRQCNVAEPEKSRMGIMDYCKRIALLAACAPLGSLMVLSATKAVPFEGVWLGHVYFNLNIFSKLNTTIGLAIIPKLSMNMFFCLALFTAVALVPIVITILVSDLAREPQHADAPRGRDRQPRNRTYLYLSAIFTSLSLLSLGYRVGYLALNDFHSLPYVAPALYMLVVYGCRLQEEIGARRQSMPVRAQILNRYMTGFLTVCLPLISVSWHRIVGVPAIQVGPNLHYLIDDSADRKDLRRQFIERVIYAIETSGRRRATIFGWPFTPWIYPIFQRASAFGLTGFLWYNELVEKDSALRHYQICSKKPEEYPDIILYRRWVTAGGDSDKYGACVIRLQKDYYYHMGEDIYILKSDKAVLDRLKDIPKFWSIFMKPNWSGLPERASLTPVALTLNRTTIFRVHPKESRSTDTLGVMLGTYRKKNSGTITICMVTKNGQRSCSIPVAKETLTDNAVRPFYMSKSTSLPKDTEYTIEITDETPQYSSSRGNQIAVYLLPANPTEDIGIAPEVATWTPRIAR